MCPPARCGAARLALPPCILASRKEVAPWSSAVQVSGGPGRAGAPAVDVNGGGTLHLAPQLRVQGLQPSPLDVAGRGWCLHGVSPLCCGRRRPRPLTTHTVALGEG